MYVPINFLIVALLLILLIVVSYKTSKFGSIYNGSLTPNVVLTPAPLYPATDNGYTMTITYKLPSGTYYSQGAAPANTYYYKWPLLYMFQANQISPVSANQNAAFITNNVLLADGTPGPMYGFLRPSTTVLAATASVSGDAQYNPVTPSSEFTKDSLTFPANMINLSNLLTIRGNIPTWTGNGAQIPANPAYSIAAGVAGVLDAGSVWDNTVRDDINWSIPGTNQVITVPMTTGRKYIIGIALQLNTAPSGAAPSAPFTRRYGRFTYTDFTPGTVEGSPGNVAISSVNFGQLLI